MKEEHYNTSSPPGNRKDVQNALLTTKLQK